LDTSAEGLSGLNLLKYTPVHVLWNGHEAVIMFFILSGFVLSLSLIKDNGEVKYRSFIVKRICRIYIPYFAALIFCLFCYGIFKNAQLIPDLSTWFNGYWKAPVYFKDILNFIFLIGFFDPAKLNGPVWTLIHEMRISIIFPFIVSYIIVKRNWKTSIVIGGTVALISYICSRFINLGNLFETFQYVFMFIIGLAYSVLKEPLARS